jgi:hypothetical protein
MINKEWLDSLKPGDEVAYKRNRPGIGSGSLYAFSKVKKVSPTGKVITLECGKQFNIACGYERTTQGFRGRLIPVGVARQEIHNEEVKKSLRDKRESLKTACLSKIEQLDIASLEKLKVFLDAL